jgi:hypothetical protein
MKIRLTFIIYRLATFRRQCFFPLTVYGILSNIVVAARVKFARTQKVRAEKSRIRDFFFLKYPYTLVTMI